MVMLYYSAAYSQRDGQAELTCMDGYTPDKVMPVLERSSLCNKTRWKCFGFYTYITYELEQYNTTS